MSQRESKLSRRIMDALRKHGVFCFKNHGSEYTMNGLPDIIACVEGYFIGLEVKVPDNRDGSTATQKLVRRQIQQARGKSYVVCSVDEALHRCGLDER